MKTILIAGGAGFIGSHLTESLLDKGYNITVVDDLSSGLEKNLSKVRSKIKFVRSDISEFKSKEHYDVVVNLASRASRVEWETLPVEVALTNSIGNNNLIKLALREKSLYIYASSSEVYGDPDVVPTPETYVGRVSTTGSRSPYDEGKRFGEALTKGYEREYGLMNIIVRLFNTYGPRMRGGDFYGRVVDRFVQQAIAGIPITIYGDGKQTRSFTYVADSVNALETLIINGKHGEVYNVGNDVETTILDLANEVKRICKSSSPIKFMDLPDYEPRRRSADITKIKNLGFQHKVSLPEGIEKMANYHGEMGN
ncbi:dTDP-glucose 4,6-dehydratase [Thermoplasmatales archaeon]|nr:dTDP-glucose 4,6-dehydratase [Thermoplasmatales archaeon]